MTLVQRLNATVFLVAIAGVGLAPQAQAHGDHSHHHHADKKQKAYNKGYRKGYRRAIENSHRQRYRRYHYTHLPVYAPVPRRVIVSPAPWMVPVHPYHQRTRVNVGLGFNL